MPKLAKIGLLTKMAPQKIWPFFGNSSHVFGRFTKFSPGRILIFWILNLRIIICPNKKNDPRYILVSVHVTDTSGQKFQKVENDENRFFAITSSKLFKN